MYVSYVGDAPFLQISGPPSKLKLSLINNNTDALFVAVVPVENQQVSCSGKPGGVSVPGVNLLLPGSRNDCTGTCGP